MPSYEMAAPTHPNSCVARDEVLSWRGPSDPGDARTLAAWCRTVGSPVVLDLPRTSVPAIDVDSLAIVTWNVWVGGGDLESFMSEQLDFRCGEGAPVGFAVLLQEVRRASPDLPDVTLSSFVPAPIEPDFGSDGSASDVVGFARRCGLAMVYVPAARNGPGEDGQLSADKGNAILSNLPLTELAAIELPFETERRVSISATIKGPAGEPVRVVSVHLDVASTLTRTLLSGNSNRLRQVLGLTTALGAMEPRPTILGGDFNTWSGSEATLRRLALLFPDSPDWDGSPTRGVFPTDHIFFDAQPSRSAQLTAYAYRRIEPQYGSDHAARIMWLGRDDVQPSTQRREKVPASPANDRLGSLP